MSSATLLVTIRGQVQGVGYRAWLEQQARASGLDGWVRNQRDGAVEALFSGRATAVAQMVALCRHGPPLARVESVISETADEDQLELRYPGERFSVLPTI